MSHVRKPVHSRRTSSWAQLMIPEMELQKFKSLFTYMDSDGDGVITCQELAQSFSQVGLEMSASDAKVIIRDVNPISGGEFISQGDFLVLMCRKHLNSIPEQINELVSAFKAIDRDHDGFINAADLLSVLQSAGHRISLDDVMNIIQASDPDHIHNDHISLESFLKLM